MGGVFAGAEVVLHVDRAEVEAECAVVAAGDGDELADEDVRVALAGGRRLCLAESEVILTVAGDDAGECCPHLQSPLLES